MYTEFHVYFENIRYYFTEFNMVQKLKYTNKIGVTSWQHFGQNKIRTAVKRRLKRYTPYKLVKFTYFHLHFKQRYAILEE